MFLDPAKDDFLCFIDFPLMEIPNKNIPYTLCPKCKGHGGWNLKVNSYKLPEGVEDTSENRHRYCHFRAHCGQCNGWGWVQENSIDAKCMHDYIELTYKECLEHNIKHFGMCWHVYRCSKCGTTKSVDSSD